MSTPTLMRVSCINKDKSIGLENYADMLIYDKDNTLIALRMGGYPETILAMSEVIQAGCSLQVEEGTTKVEVTSLGKRNYEKKISHDGVYAEAMMYLKDSASHSVTLGDDERSEKETVDLNRDIYIFCKDDDELFTELDRKLSVPLIPEYKDYFISELKQRKLLKPLKIFCIGREFCGWHMNLSKDEKEIVAVLEDGLKSGQISIPGGVGSNNAIFENISTFTQYLQEFGKNIAERIKQSFPPVFNPAEEIISPVLEEVNNFVIENAGYSLFDAQLGAAEALRRQLEKDKMAILVSECGTGKTKIGSAALYAYQHSNPERKVYNKAFNVVVCPSHITKKWVRELHQTIPNCFAMHVSTMAEVDMLYDIYKNGNKTVYCILSKETARNGYMKKPAVIWDKKRKGFICPHCGNLQEMKITEDNESYYVPADAAHYLNEHGENHKCKFCNEPLWEMLNPNNVAPNRNPWVRIGAYGFIHRKFVNQAYVMCRDKIARRKIEEVVNNPNGVFHAPGAYERYPLSAYIKRKLKRIDGIIIDELHQYSGESAQGQAMAELAGIADKVIGMTATLINGYAKGIFYLLFRLKAHLMLADDYKYSSSRDFCMQYGVVEQVYEVGTKQYGTTTKNIRHRTREKFLPGLSPLVYSRYLLENAVFLSLADMGKELPDYEEIPFACNMHDEVKGQYKAIENEFKRIMMREKKLGNRIMSAFVNLLTAYPDQPYGHEPIYNPFNEIEKEALIEPRNYGDITVKQPKDESVIDLVKRKVENGERVIIYTAWTRLDTQTKLHTMLTNENIRTAILDQRVPTVKREEWVDKRLAEGVKVLIVNPALVETGLDLNAFTTLIFYNIAYNLYIFRQAARRSYRINQTAPKVEVYMLYYKDTMQQRALRLMASKLSAATVIEGNISDEGLAALSSCEDMTTQLAKELMSGIKEDAETLADTFKKMAIHSERQDKKEAPVLKVVSVPEETVNTPEELKPQPIVVIKPNIEIRKTTAKKYDTGQMSIFDLLAS